MIESRSMSIKPFFADKLRKFRLESGLSQKDLAENAGLSHKYIYRLESGEANPSIQIVNMLARTLGVPFIDFFTDENGNNVEFVIDSLS